jgi:hypothetical protein
VGVYTEKGVGSGKVLAAMPGSISLQSPSDGDVVAVILVETVRSYCSF